uniref:UVR domain-containing protein n=1 Tax=Cannabis sativa TaxID=3483 RepID=A0A803PSW1_CANSA
MVFPEAHCMARLFTPKIANYYEEYYKSKGVNFVKGTVLSSFEIDTDGKNRKEAIANEGKAAQTLHRASNAYAELETRLDEACRSEDFETAETLSESLAAAEFEKQTLVAALADAEARCEKL